MWMLAELTAEGRGKLLVTLGVLMVIVVVGFVGIMLIRRKWCAEDASSEGDTGFSLASLRELRDRGEITREEYARASAKVVAKVKEVLEPAGEEDEPVALKMPPSLPRGRSMEAGADGRGAISSPPPLPTISPPPPPPQKQTRLEEGGQDGYQRKPY